VENPSLRSLYALVLAAGASRRYGSPKQLALIDGVPMLRRVLDTAVSVLPPDAEGPRVTVVLGAHAPAIRAAIDLRDVRELDCAEWDSGIAHSLRCGLAALARPGQEVGAERQRPDPSSPAAALVMLGDTPFVSAADLRRLIIAWQAAPETPAAAEYDGAVGAPCILPRAIWPELAALTGDRGAGAWLRHRLERGAALARCALGRAATDVDRPGDLHVVQRSSSSPGVPGAGGRIGTGSSGGDGTGGSTG
jgi:molybdenum cofactor cytidylyltransferase